MRDHKADSYKPPCQRERVKASASKIMTLIFSNASVLHFSPRTLKENIEHMPGSLSLPPLQEP